MKLELHLRVLDLIKHKLQRVVSDGLKNGLFLSPQKSKLKFFSQIVFEDINYVLLTGIVTDDIFNYDFSPNNLKVNVNTNLDNNLKKTGNIYGIRFSENNSFRIENVDYCLFNFKNVC